MLVLDGNLEFLSVFLVLCRRKGRIALEVAAFKDGYRLLQSCRAVSIELKRCFQVSSLCKGSRLSI